MTRIETENIPESVTYLAFDIFKCHICRNATIISIDFTFKSQYQGGDIESSLAFGSIETLR